MVIEFQENLLKYLFQSKEAKQYKDYLSAELFDVPTWQQLYKLWHEYVTKYNSTPSKPNFLEYFDIQLKATKGNIKPEVVKEVRNTIAMVYRPMPDDTPFIRESIIAFAKRKRTKLLFNQNAEKVKDGDDVFFDHLQKEFGKIYRLGEEDDIEQNRGMFLLKDNDEVQAHEVKAYPTFLKALNHMTAAGGFYSPQLIVFMGGAKRFKTGILLKLLLEYMRDGLNVYIADTENGIMEIRVRLQMAILECEWGEVRKLKKKLAQLVKRLEVMGGDIKNDFYPADTKSLNDVDAELTYLKDQYGWKPKVIGYDYLDRFISVDKDKNKELRHRIQSVYLHAVRLNKKWDTFSLTISPVKKEAVDKPVIRMQDFGEDFMKAYNCHAAFAICGTDDEVAQHTRRIIPVAQRTGTVYDGTENTTCAIQLNEETMEVHELDSKAYLIANEMTAEQLAENNRSPQRHKRSRNTNTNIIDDN